MLNDIIEKKLQERLEKKKRELTRLKWERLKWQSAADEIRKRKQAQETSTRK